MAEDRSEQLRRQLEAIGSLREACEEVQARSVIAIEAIARLGHAEALANAPYWKEKPEGDLALWASLKLLELRERFVMPASKREWCPKEGLGDDWSDGSIDARYLGLLARDEKHPNWLYLAVLRSGEIRVVHDGSFERARKATVQKKLNVSSDDLMDGLPSGILLKANEVLAMKKNKQDEALLARLTHLLREFSALYD